MAHSPLKDLPLGIQTFDLLIQENCLYVDKTEPIYHLARKRGRYFLSRPRRFGKSLLISTFEALFQGKRELFKDLWIDSSNYSWGKYPVITLDFSGFDSSSQDSLKTDLVARLGDIAQAYDVQFATDEMPQIRMSPSRALTVLIKNLCAKTGKRVVVLVDEYDYPILKHLTNQALRDPIHEFLKGFYTALKSMDRSLYFFFVTGVSKFSKTSLFSGFNNLTDLTLDERSAHLLGYTETELDCYFTGWIAAAAQKCNMPVGEIRDKMRLWYNGYRFSYVPIKVYNPFSVLNFLDVCQFLNFWFVSGTPTFLMQLMKEGNYALNDIESVRMGALDFEAVEIDQLKLELVLFQTGYITIVDYAKDSGAYTLAYPNEEVRTAFCFAFVDYFANMKYQDLKDQATGLRKALEIGDTEQFFARLRTFFAGIPYNIQLPLEKYYQSMLLAVLQFIGIDAHAEVCTNQGRIDVTIETKKQVYIIECKVDAPCAIALEQIRAKKYYEPYLHTGKQIVLIGLVFDTKARTLGECLVEALD
jgi:hypothetical protein